MDVVKYILEELPNIIEYEGVTFGLILFANNDHDFRVCYDIFSVDLESPHFDDYKQYGSWNNPFNDSFCDFLYLVENIENAEELLQALKDMHQWLIDADSNLINFESSL